MGATEGALLGAAFGLWILLLVLVALGADQVMHALVQGFTGSRRGLEREIDSD